MSCIVSACLLGHYCRYDGKTKRNEAIIKTLEEKEIAPFCPEAPLFGTPRERIDLIKQEDRVCAIIRDTQEDVTDALIKQTRAFIKQHPKADTIILKSKSPSCALGSAPIYNSRGDIVGYGDGIAAATFKRHYKNSTIVDELTFIKQKEKTPNNR